MQMALSKSANKNSKKNLLTSGGYDQENVQGNPYLLEINKVQNSMNNQSMYSNFPN